MSVYPSPQHFYWLGWPILACNINIDTNLQQEVRRKEQPISPLNLRVGHSKRPPTHAKEESLE